MIITDDLSYNCFTYSYAFFEFIMCIRISWIGVSQSQQYVDQIIFCCGVCAVYCRMPASIPGLYPLCVSINALPSCDNQNTLDITNIPWASKSILVENYWAILCHKK